MERAIGFSDVGEQELAAVDGGNFMSVIALGPKDIVSLVDALISLSGSCGGGGVPGGGGGDYVPGNGGN